MMNLQKRILVIDFCNYKDYPVGGYLSFVKNLMESFNGDLILVGITTDLKEPVGKWYKKEINGHVYDYFAVARYSKNATKHLIPDRFAIYSLLKYYKKNILEIEVNNVFIQRQEILHAVRNFNFKNICYCFAGLENPLAISKYSYARFLARKFEESFFSSLKNVKIILASGDEKSIGEMVERSNGIITRNSVIKFPTRINTDIFYLSDKTALRKQLNIPENVIAIVTTGRLARLKGWKFMIDSFILFEREKGDSVFYIIGDGEDMQKIKSYIEFKNLTEKVKLLGRKHAEEIALYLNASDLFIMGSYKEGWSTSLSEAIACGIPSCVTDFSSANEIIIEGANGYVITEHNEVTFVKGMKAAINIPKPIYNENVLAFASNKLKRDLLKIWELI